MSGEIEAAGALATAGLAARELNRRHARSGASHAEACLNCGTALTGPYCAACGQPGHVERKLSHAFEELLHGLIHFDSKAWRTLPLLAFRPGTLTRNYIHGMRVRYIPPVALFLFTVFLMFFAFALMGEAKLGPRTPKTMAQLEQSIVAARANVAEAEADVKVEQAELDRLLANPDAAEPGEIGGQTGALAGARGALVGEQADLKAAEAALARRKERIAQFQQARAQLDCNETKAKAENDTASINDIATARSIVDRALADPTGPPEGLNTEVSPDGKIKVNVAAIQEDRMQTIFREVKEANARGGVKVNTGNKKWDEKIRYKLDNPELAWYKIQNTAYKFSFLLVPISLPFLWLMFFWKRGVSLYDHAVFSLYSLSFMSLLFLVFAALMRTPEPYLEPVLGGFGQGVVIAIPAHIFFHLKGTYALGWFSALWRTGAMLVFAAVSLALFIGVIFVLGLLG